MSRRYHSSLYKKIALWVFLSAIGLPIIAFLLSPLFGGFLILRAQMALYRQQGSWVSLSLLETATYTVDKRLANKLYWPTLSSCQETHIGLESLRNQNHLGAEEMNALVKQRCPQLHPWQRWLLYPTSRPRFHRIASFSLHRISASFLLLATSLWMFYLVGIMGWKHK
ncbi:MAG: hypothetical protein HY647_11370 [Acidobacteria bacterium]|nr:hypothetical protein [Acidobacteriota bacterium]